MGLRGSGAGRLAPSTCLEKQSCALAEASRRLSSDDEWGRGDSRRTMTECPARKCLIRRGNGPVKGRTRTFTFNPGESNISSILWQNLNSRQTYGTKRRQVCLRKFIPQGRGLAAADRISAKCRFLPSKAATSGKAKNDICFQMRNSILMKLKNNK